MRRRRAPYAAPVGTAPQRTPPTYPEYEQLLADAKAALAAEGMFVDPAKVHQVQTMPRSWEWRVCVLGHAGDRSRLDLHLLLLAHERDLNPPLPQWLVDARADGAREDARKAQERAERDALDQAAWEKVLADCQVDVSVLRNGTARVRYGYLHHLGHVVPQADAVSGTEKRPRLHLERRALCETEDRGQPLDLSGGEGGPATCMRCLAYTPKIRPAAVAV